MSTPEGLLKLRAEPASTHESLSPEIARVSTNESSTSSTNGGSPFLGFKTPDASSSPPSPIGLSRNQSFSNASEEWEVFPPLDRLTIFDLLDNLALPQRLEKWQNRLSVQTERVRRQREKLRLSGFSAKDRVVEEWRRRLPPPDEQLEKYRKRMRESVDRLGTRWNDTKAVTLREKLSFIAGVLNIFISGYLIGALPDLFYCWFTAQLCYFMPIRLFIHLMPPVTLHCLVHLTSPSFQKARFPAIYAIRYSPPESPEHYSLWAMMIWATVPYTVWQLSYHFLITVRRREKIAAGRPTSFTWLRKSYSKTWIGRLVLSLPENLHEPAFMLVQYAYALGTMIPCPVWFWYRWPSAGFLMAVFVWSIYNGATYYIDVFGKRFQNELEQLKKDVAKWQTSPEMATSPEIAPKIGEENITPLAKASGEGLDGSRNKWRESIDGIPMLDPKNEESSLLDGRNPDVLRQRRPESIS